MAWEFPKIALRLKERPDRQWQFPVAVSMAVALVIMTGFEIVKYACFPHLRLWVSNAITILFTSLLAAGVTFLAVRLYVQLLKQTVDEVSERMRVTSELGHERLLMRALMDHTPDHIYFKDTDGRFLRINRSQAANFGLAGPAEAVGKTDFDFFGADHARQAKEDEDAIILSGQAMIGKEERENWPDGRVTWVSTTKVPLRDRKGNVIGTFGISRDITEEKRADERLQAEFRRREELERIINRSPVALYLWRNEPGWPVEFVSENVAAMGYARDEMLSGALPYSGLIHPDDLPRVGDEVADYTRRNIDDFTQTYRLRRKDGQYRWIEDRTLVRRDASGRITHFEGIVVDISDRRAAEEAAQDMTRGLRGVLEAADELIACPDVDSVFRRAVELAREKLGLERCGIIIERDGMLCNTFGTDMAGRTTDERGFSFEKTDRWRDRLMLRPPTETRWMMGMETIYDWNGTQVQSDGRQGIVVSTPIQTAERAIGVFCNDYAISGRAVSPVTQDVVAVYCSILANIISRKQAEAESRRREAMQREVMERTDRLNSLGMLAAGMAHEINNPLQGMMTHLHLAARKLPPDFAGRESLLMVERGMETIAQLVRKLLTLGSSQEGGGQLAVCGEVIQFVTQLFESQFRRARVKLLVKDSCALQRIAMPRRELIQVLTNLLINARDAMPEGGEITMASRREDHQLELSIRDTGHGIPPEIVTQIFTPFFTTKGTKGTGLGLSVAESLVRNAGGTIHVASEPGLGAEFTIRLPTAGDES